MQPFAIPSKAACLPISLLEQPGLGPWHSIFYMTAGLLILEAILYGTFASAEEQNWSQGDNQNGGGPKDHQSSEVLNTRDDLEQISLK